MKLLVTGAGGFVGSHLVNELEGAGHAVLGTDIHFDGRDLSLPYRAEGLIKRARPEYVVHLAARYGRLLCADEPHKAVADNTASTTEIAAVCAELDIPVLYTSSSEVYGDHGEDLISETSELRMPTTIYGLSKRWGEEVLRLYSDDWCIVRMNMLYGPGQLGGYGRCSLATFIKNAVAGKPYTVHRRTTRSWLYISDAVRALRLLIEDDARGIYNLGHTAAPRPMTETAFLVAAMTGEPAEIEDPPPGQIKHKMYDIRKLRQRIDWEPEVGLEEGIKLTVAWARQAAQLEAAA